MGQGEVVYYKGIRRLFRRGFEPGEEAIMLAVVHLFHEEKEKAFLCLGFNLALGSIRLPTLRLFWGRLLCIKQNLFT